MYAQIQFLLHLRPRPALLLIVVYDLRSQQYEFITKGGACSLTVAASSSVWLVSASQINRLFELYLVSDAILSHNSY